MILHIHNDELGYVEVEVTEVEASDICPITDEYVDSIEANGGWWEVYRLPDGMLVAYFEEDEEYFDYLEEKAREEEEIKYGIAEIDIIMAIIF